MSEGESAGLRWTGHPLVDHGIATLVAFANDAHGGLSSPADVTLDDLEAFAQYAEDTLKAKTVTSHASVLFTSNVPYLQPSFSAEKKATNARWLFRLHEAGSPGTGEPCLYCGRPSVSVRAVGKSDRLYRELVPLLTGQDVINFAPAGDHGLSICSRCIVSLQALLFGAPSCEGRALVVQADDPSFLVSLVAAWLHESRKRIQFASIDEKAITWKAPKTRLIEQLVALHHADEQAEQASGLTIFHLSNSGQGPGIGIYRLSARVVRFVRRAQGARFHQAWQHLRRRAWRDEKYKDADHDPPDDKRPYWRNTFYEQLFDLPDGAGRFVRTRLKAAQVASLTAKTSDSHVPMWALTALFLEEVIGVDKVRVEAIRDLGDILAGEVLEHDHRIFQSAVRLRNYPGVRRLLVQIGARRLKRGDPPAVTFKTFQIVFDEVLEIAQADWRLAWDLVLIRIMERLHEHKEQLDAVTADLELDETEDLSTIESI